MAASVIVERDKEEFLKSSKNLWILISGSSLRSKELVGTELQANFPKLSRGLLYYKNSSATSIRELKDVKKLDEKLTTIVLQLSRFMNLDEIQCYNLFCEFLLYDFRGQTESLTAIAANERLLHNLMLQLWDYYCCERLYLLLCVKEILAHQNNDHHPYQELFKDFMVILNNDGAFYKSLTDQWSLLQKKTFVGSKVQASFIIDSQSQKWMLFNLREQCELLQILLLFCKERKLTNSEFFALVTTFKDHSFGRNQPHKYLSNEDSGDILNAIGYLECLIILQNLRLKDIYAGNDGSEYFLSPNQDKWQEMNSLVGRLGYQKEHGPIILAWAIVHSHVLLGKDAQVTRGLGQSALDLNAFSYLNCVLESLVFQGDGSVADCAQSVLYDLISAMLHEFDESSLSSSLVLLKVVGQLVKNCRLAKNVWERGLGDGPGALLISLMRRFPYSFSPFVDVLSSLASASLFSAREVLKFFKTLPCCTLPRDPHVPMDCSWDMEDGNSFCLVEDYYPFNVDCICLPSGTIGRLHPGIKASVDIIEFTYQFNGWTMCFVVVDQLLHEFGTGTEQVSMDLIARTTSVAQLVKCLLSSDPSLFEQFVPLLDKLFSTCSRVVDMSQMPLDLVALILNTATLFSGRLEAKQIWSKIAQTGILPVSSPAEIALKTDLNESAFGGGFIKKLITAHECISGDYKVTLAFLNLVSEYAEIFAEEADNHFVACIIFIVDEIIPSYAKWWFSNIEQQEQVGQKCLDVLHRILGVSFVDKGEGSGCDHRLRLQNAVVYKLLHQEAGQSLLHLICTGEEAIHCALERQTSWVSGRGLELIRLVKLALSVLNRLLFLRPHGDEMMPSLVSSLSSQPRTIRIVANYVYHRFDIRLATLAMLLMRRFANELPISLLVCLGPDASSFSKHLVVNLGACTADVHLKVAILKFMTSCVASQPGMTEVFVKNSHNLPSDSEIETETSCLCLILHILRQYKESPSSSSRELRYAALSFVQALWVGRQAVALSALRQNADLWHVLLEPMQSDGLINENIREATCVFGIFAQEFLCKPAGATYLHSKEICKALTAAVESSLFSKCAKTIFETLSANNAANKNGVIGLMESWRDFILIGAKNKYLEIPVEQKVTILDSCFRSLIDGISVPRNRSLLVIHSETLLLLLHLWQEECKSHIIQWTESLSLLMQPILTSGDIIPLKVVSDILTVCMVVSRSVLCSWKTSLADVDESVLCTWMSITCAVLHRCIMEFEKLPSNEEEQRAKSHLLVLCVTMMQKLSCASANCSIWLAELQKKSIIHSLHIFSVNCIRLQIHVKPCLAVLEFLASLSRFDKICELLFADDIIYTICIPLLTLPVFESADTKSTQKIDKTKWVDVYEAGIRLLVNILCSQRHFVVTSALDFIIIHVEKFHVLPGMLHKQLTKSRLESAFIILMFIHELSLFPSEWKLHSGSPSKHLLEFALSICYVAVAYLLRPHSILQSLGEVSEDGRNQGSEDEETVRSRRISSSTEESEKPNAKLQEMRTRLIEVLSLCMGILCNFTPNLCELLANESCDVSQWELLLDVGFGTPSLEKLTPSSFGTILSCTAVCTRLLNLADCATSPARTPQKELSLLNRPLIIFLLERSLYLIMSQASLILRSTWHHSWDKQLFKRELAAELSSCIQSRYIRRGMSALSPVGSSLAVSPMTSRSRSSIEKWPYMNFLASLVDVLLK